MNFYVVIVARDDALMVRYRLDSITADKGTGALEKRMDVQASASCLGLKTDGVNSIATE